MFLLALWAVGSLVQAVLVAAFAADYHHASMVFTIWFGIPIHIYCAVTFEQLVGGVVVNMVTNYRIVVLTIRRNYVTSEILSYSCISGTYTSPKTMDFIVENSHLHHSNALWQEDNSNQTDQFSTSNRAEVQRVSFRDIPDVHKLENIIQEYMNKSQPAVGASRSEFAPKPALTSFSEMLVDEEALSKNYTAIYEQTNEALMVEGSGETALGTPLYITKPNKHLIIWNKISPSILLWLWLSGLLILPQLLGGHVDSRLLQTPMIGLYILIPIAMCSIVILFSSDLVPADVLTSNKILIFRTGIRSTGTASCSWGPRVNWYTYRHAFPMICEMEIATGRGNITFTNIVRGELKLASGPGLVERQEIIFRNHCNGVS